MKGDDLTGGTASDVRVALGLLQMRCGADSDDNLSRALRGIGHAAGLGARIVCLPELFRTQYFCQEQNADHFDLAEPVPGPTTEALAEAARLHGVVIVGSVFERRLAGVYHNAAVVLDADGAFGWASRVSIPAPPNGYRWTNPGQAPDRHSRALTAQARLPRACVSCRRGRAGCVGRANRLCARAAG